MDAKVAVVKIKEDSMQALQEALNLLGGIAELNTTGHCVAVCLTGAIDHEDFYTDGGFFIDQGSVQ